MEPTPKPLVVLSVAYPLAPVGADAVGGAEQVLTSIDDALVEAGHRSIVIACEGSACRGKLVTIELPSLFDARGRATVHARVRAAIAGELERQAIDLVHVHGVDFNAYLPRTELPLLATLHLPIPWYPHDVFSSERPNTYLNCVSATQRTTCPAGALLLDDVPNGVPLERFAPAKTKGDFVLALGRISPEKGFHFALEAARLAGVRMLLAGKVFAYESHQQHFQRDIVPRLDASRVFVGALGAVEKARALAAARCLLLPSAVPETSSLVAMEALASGTPVVAFRTGALADIVDHGTTGFLVSNAAEMADAIGRVGDLRPEDCRRAAEERFSAAKMCQTYLALYRRLASVHAG